MAAENRGEDRKQIDALKAKRNKIFAQLEKDPGDTRLALEIKTIDDQVAERIRQMQQKKRSLSSSR